MPARRRATTIRRRRPAMRRGRGIFGDILGSVLPAAGGMFGPIGGLIGGVGGKLAGRIGFGRRRRTVRRAPVRRVARRRVGGSFFGKLKSLVSAAHGLIKSNRLVSRGLSHFGHKKLATAASALGYGRRRRTVRRRVVRRRR